MEKLECKYYVYDLAYKKFIMIDGELAEIGQGFVDELNAINVSYLKFVKKDEYERNGNDLIVNSKK